MEPIINKNMQSGTIKEVEKGLKLRGDGIWHIYYDTGVDYIDQLALRLKKKNVFDTMFKRYLNDGLIGKMKPSELLTKIKYSPCFWEWWSMQLWNICKQYSFQNETELKYALQFNNSLIPHFIIKKIFYGNSKQKFRGNKGIVGSLESKTTEVKLQKSNTGKKVGSRI